MDNPLLHVYPQYKSSDYLLELQRTHIQNKDIQGYGLPLEEIQQERDIGVVISNDLKPSKQCAEAARRASGLKSIHV